MSFALLAVAVFIGGVFTILSPCILPILPFAFVSAGRPFIRWTAPMLGGLVAAFVLVATAGTAGAAWVAEATDAGRWIALVLLAMMGLALLWPALASAVTRPLVRLGASVRTPSGDNERRSAVRAFVLGAATGLLWAPCAGPVLGLVIALGASGVWPGRAATLFAVFGAGAAVSLGIALLAGERALRRLRRFGGAEVWVRRGLGGLAVAAAVVIALGWDAGLLARGGLVRTANAEEAVLRVIAPDAKANVRRALAARVAAPSPSKSRLPDYGPLPDFAGGTGWINGAALGLSGDGGTLTAASLRGMVVVVNVWTFACYNCLNALPHIESLEARHRGQGVVVIGVHTPELARERVPSNVVEAVRRLRVTYPVVLDPKYAIWSAFKNEYWPSVYIADRAGRIRFRHFGEGRYDEEERVVTELLAEPAATGIE